VPGWSSERLIQNIVLQPVSMSPIVLFVLWLHTIITFFRNKAKRCGNPQRPKVGFNDLPVEVLLEVVKYLRDIDHLCLAITCKSLLHHLDESKTLQRLPKFRASTYFSPFTFSSKCKIYSDRWKLLGRLEDRHWRRCFGCFGLHPFYEFSAEDLQTPASRRTCVFGPLVGVARLCPCMDITFRHKRKLAKLLLSQSHAERYRIHDGFIDFVGAMGQHQCSHSYKRRNGETADLNCDVYLIMEESDNFVVETRYTITGTQLPSEFDTGIMLPCPHRSLNCHLLDFDCWQIDQEYHYRYSKYWKFYSDGSCEWKFSKRPMACPHCQTTISNVRHKFPTARTTAADRTCVFTSRRRFGKAMDKADDIWYQHTETAFEAIYFQQ
jgi:F-box domain